MLHGRLLQNVVLYHLGTMGWMSYSAEEKESQGNC